MYKTNSLLHYIAHTNFQLLSIPILHYNFKNILISHGFDKKKHHQNIYVNLYDALKNAIAERGLEKGLRLPPSRVLAKDLGISRSTVLKAYDLLALEKYVNSIPSSGYYINSIKDKKIQYNLSTQIEKGEYPKISKRGISFRKNIQLINNNSEKGIAFRPGLPPLDVFPIQLWKRLTNDFWKSVKPSQLSYSNTIGIDNLRKNISDYLRIYRNINCSSEQIIVTTGSLHSLSLIGDALIDKKDEVVIENPTYPHAYHLFNSLQATICAASIDEEGIVINELNCNTPKLIYTTPSNQYPTGVKMSFSRRLELLNWAAKNNSVIIEDDYDHEFSNWRNPISSVFSMDNQQRTIYLGTFNKLLHPSIRLGYMIVPHFLIDIIKALYEQSSRFVSPDSQKILSDFIEKDYLNKQLRKVIEVSIERKKVFLETFSSNFESDITINPKNTGLHIIGNLKTGISDIQLSNHMKQNGIVVHPYSNYFINGKKQNGLVMGYCSTNTKIIKETIFKMKKEYSKFTEN